ncbi:uncharacterized protein PEZ65_022722 isoform 1-T1 [Lycodopsis pacificus]
MALTPGPATAQPHTGRPRPPPLDPVTEMPTCTSIDVDDGAFAALIGGLVGCALLLLICVIVLLLWEFYRRKGSYVTNETDDGEDDEDDECDAALQSRKSLTTKEDD